MAPIGTRAVEVRGDLLYTADEGGGMHIHRWSIRDSDRDALPDAWELRHFGSLTNVPSGDFDVDGLSNWGEYLAGFDPANSDQNGNGRPDGEDVWLREMDPSGQDRDSDDLPDSEEVTRFHTSALSADTDGDGMPDGWEVRYGLNPTDPSDADADADHDFFNNLSEYQRGLSPANPDTDGDSLPDGWEVRHGLNPTNVPTPMAGIVMSPLGSYAGTVTDVQIVSDLAYVADFYYGLKILDVQSPEAPALLGRLNLYGAYRVRQQGGRAYVARSSLYDFFVVDVTNSAAPSVLGSISLGENRAEGFCIRSNLAFLAIGNGGLAIVDISVATNPVLRATSAVTGFTYNVTVASNLAFLAAETGGLQIFDVSNPSLPRWIGAYTNATSVYDVQVVSNLAYVVDALTGLLILDITNPSMPVLRGRLALPPWAAEHVCVASGWAYITSQYASVRVVDVSTTTNPVELVSYDITSAMCFDVASNHLYIAQWDQGLKILKWDYTDSDRDGLPDVWERENFGMLTYGPQSDPDHDGISNWGEYLAGLNPTNNDQNANGVIDGTEIGTYNLDPRQDGGNTDTDGDGLTDTAELTVYHTNPGNVDTDGDGMPDGWEIANGLDPINAADAVQDKDVDFLSNLAEYQRHTNPSNADSDGDGLPDGWELRYGLNPLDQTGGLPDMALFDRSSIDIAGVPYDLQVVSNRAYLATENGLEVLDVSDPTNALHLGSASLSSCYGLHVVSNIAYLAGYGGLHIVDITTPTNLTRIGLSPYTPNWGNSVQVYSNWAFATDDRFVSVIDVSVPTNPVVRATLTNALGQLLKIVGNLLYVAGSELKVFDLATPSNPALLGTCQLPITPTSLGIVSNYAFVGGWTGGVTVVDISVSTNPILRGSWDAPQRPRCIAGVSLDQVYVADLTSGLWTVDFSKLTNPIVRSRVQFGDQWYYCSSVSATSNRVYAGVYSGSGVRRLYVYEPYVVDTDQDGLPDWWELHYFNSLAQTAMGDSNGDGIPNLGEYRAGFNPTYLDSDGDGLSDAAETTVYGTSPMYADTDGDGVMDWEEVNPGADGYITDPLKIYTDGDGLTDYEETHPGPGAFPSDPTKADTDGDGMSDYEENLAGTDPTNPQSVLHVISMAPVGIGHVTLLWSAAPGRTYRVEYKEALDDTAWTNLGAPVSNDGATAWAVDVSAASHVRRFYRIVVQ